MLPGLLGVGVVSLFANLPMLAGPLYMMQIYDRVLTSGSVQTLVALTVLVIGLYAVFCLLDGIRARMLTRLAALYEARRAAAVFKAMMGNLTQRWLAADRAACEQIAGLALQRNSKSEEIGLVEEELGKIEKVLMAVERRWITSWHLRPVQSPLNAPGGRGLVSAGLLKMCA